MIEISRNGEIVSRVCFGETAAEAAKFLSGKLFLVYDCAAERYALAIEQAVVAAGEAGVAAGAAGSVASCPSAGGAAPAVILGKYALKDVSEDTKTIETVEDICRWLLDRGADRDATVVAVGGGIVTDMAGFAAAIYKRGIKAVYVPTTLLAQVDAAIGGKTGVNLDAYKNIIGVFKQPEITYICPEVLETLPDGVFRAGLAEMLKTFIIENEAPEAQDAASPAASSAAQDAASPAAQDATSSACGNRVERMVAVVQEINAAGSFAAASPAARTEFGRLVAEAAGVKAGVVTRDEFESGERRKLNLGHTFAHAIEFVANSHAASAAPDSGKSASEISHGEAVAIGMAMAARLSVGLGLATEQTESDVLKALRTCGLPTECPFPLSSMLDAMKKDKKAEGGSIHFVLIRSIGDVIVRDLTVSQAADILQR